MTGTALFVKLFYVRDHIISSKFISKRNRFIYIRGRGLRPISFGNGQNCNKDFPRRRPVAESQCELTVRDKKGHDISFFLL